MSTSLRVCSSTICSKFNVQIWVSHSQFEHYFYSNLYERAQKGPRKLEYLTIKFSSSEKATKSCAIVLMVLMFTRHYLVIFFSFLYIQMWFHAQLAQKTVERLITFLWMKSCQNASLCMALSVVLHQRPF